VRGLEGGDGTLDRALLDLAYYFRDVLVLQLGAGTELINADLAAELWSAAAEATIRRLDATMECRERLEANVTPCWPSRPSPWPAHRLSRRFHPTMVPLQVDG
jgi:hypothetical protein